MSIFEESILDNKTFFYYILIFIGIVYAYSTIKISLNVVFGVAVAFIIVGYLYNDYKSKQEKENKTKALQEGNLLPKPEIFTKYSDIIKYMFSIQDFYIYNPQAYEEVTESLSLFFRTYEEAKENKKQAGTNHGLMLTYKRNAANALHSILHNLPDTTDYTDKLNRAITTLQDILDEYLEKVEKFHNEYIFDNGYNNESKIIHKGPLPYNHFNDNKGFTYNIFG
jgi:hypothetical protein